MQWRTLVWSAFVVAALGACGGGPAGGGTGAAEEPMFEEGVADDLCALLTTEDVAAATGAPGEAIEQQSAVGCAYHWEGGASWEEGSVFVSMARVHDSLEGARSFHGRTADDPTAGGGRALEGVGDEASLLGTGSVVLRYGNVTARFSGETGDQDLGPDVAQELGGRLVENLDRLAGR